MDVANSVVLLTLWSSSFIHQADCEHHVQFFFFSSTPSSILHLLSELGNKTPHRAKSFNQSFGSWSRMNRLRAAESAEMRDFVLNLCDKEKPERGCEAFNSSDVLHRRIPEEGSSGERETRRRHLRAAGRACSFMLS